MKHEPVDTTDITDVDEYVPEGYAESGQNEDLPPVETDESENGLFKHMRRKLSEGTFRTAFGLGLLLIISAKVIFDFDGFRGFLGKAGSMVLSILSYLLVGFFIAYILNTFAIWLSEHVYKKIRRYKLQRALSVITAYVLFAGVVAFILGTMIPKVGEAIPNIVKMIPDIANKAMEFYNEIVEEGRFNLPEFIKESIVSGIEGAKEWLQSFLTGNTITGMIKKVVTATGSGIFMAVMGILVSVYMLIEKDHAITAAKRVTHGLFKPERANNVIEGARKIDMVFKRYFAGKILQSIAVLAIGYIVMLIAGINYAILFASIIAITNMIPYIGPWIGAIPTVLISLVQDPWMGVKALICVLIIQMLDNWLVAPRVVGGKMGISPLLVLIGLCIGGRMFGFVGMIFGDVLAAIVKVFFYDTLIKNRIKRKVAAGELPEEYLIPDSGDGGEKPSLVSKAVGGIKRLFRSIFGKSKDGRKKKKKNKDNNTESSGGSEG